MAVNWSLAQVLGQLDSGRRWDGSTITYSFPQTAAGLFTQGEAAGFRPTNAAQQELLTLALAGWDDLVPQGFAPGAAGGTAIEFGYTSTSIGYAHAYYPTNGSTWFNVTESSLVATTVGQYGYQTFMHEVGHALGLNHMGDYNGDGNWSPSSYQDSVVLSIMSYFGPRYAAPNYSAEVMQADWIAADSRPYSPQTPMVNDVAAIQAIYGVSATTRAGDTVYGFGSTATGATARLYDFASNRQPILTIFDAGGIDTLNLSLWSSPSRIVLQGGAYSSANEMTNNIAIAFGTTIENAEGGAGNDEITGNEAANRLAGNGGDDTLAGLGGDDTLIGGSGDDTIDGGDGTDTAVFAASFASFTITVTPTLVTIAGGASGSDRIANVERFQFADALRTLAELTPAADTTPPQLRGRTPADDAGAVAPGANLVLTFDEAVKPGSGSITIVDADGTPLATIDARDAQRVRYAGTTVTIDPAPDLRPGRGYYVNIAAGALTDAAGNAYAGIAGTTAWNFTAASSDTAAPRLLGVAPAVDSSGIAPGANLVLQFDEAVTAGSGSFVIRAGGEVVRTIAAADAAQVAVQGGTVTIDPAADLPAGAQISVTVDAGAVRDLAGNAFAGEASTTAWRFATGAAVGDDYPFDPETPGVVAVGGAAASGVIETGNDFDLFRVELTAGVTYAFTLLRTPGGLADPYLALYGPLLGDPIAQDDDGGGERNARLVHTATITATHYLAAFDFDEFGTGGYTLRASVLDDVAPALQQRTPADDATQVAVGADLVLVFSEPVVRGSGSLRVLDANGAVLRDIRADGAGVTIDGATVRVDPGANLPAGTALAVVVDAGAFRDAAGNDFAGVAALTAWNFTTAAPAAGDDYPLSVDTGGSVAVGGSATNARIDAPNDGDLFRLDLVAGVTYRFDMTRPQGSGVDPFLGLYGASGPQGDIALIDFDDDGGPVALDARLYFTPATSGRYFLAAFDYAEATGAYSLSAAIPADDHLGSTATDGRVVLGGAGTGAAIDAPSDSDMFAVTLAAGTRVTFTLDGAGAAGVALADPFLALLDAAGVPLAIDDDSGRGLAAELTVAVAASGTYYLAASDFATGTGRYVLAGFARPVLAGSAGNDTLSGGAAAEAIDGGAGDDRLRGEGGNDVIDGDDGIDFALYAGRASAFDIERQDDSWAVEDGSGRQGRDLLRGVERLLFDDGPWALDVDGSAGFTVKLLGAVAGPAAAHDAAFVGIGLALLDAGMAPAALMQAALEHVLGPRPGNAAVVDLLYFNLVGAHPSPADSRVFESLIDSGAYTQAGLAMAAAESALNLANIDFATIASVGVPYQFPG